MKFLKVILFVVYFVVWPVVIAAISLEALALFYISISGHSLGLEFPVHPLKIWERILAFGLGAFLSLLPWAVWRFFIPWAQQRFLSLFQRLLKKPPSSGNPPPGGSSGPSGSARVPRPPGGHPPVLTGVARFPNASEN